MWLFYIIEILYTNFDTTCLLNFGVFGFVHHLMWNDRFTKDEFRAKEIYDEICS